MHPEADRFVAQFATDRSMEALDLGGRDVNGSCRGYFPNARWTGLDLHPGPGVDIVADATSWTPGRSWELVLCTEVLEHASKWREIVATASLAAHKWLIVTCAGPGRAPHSGIDGGYLGHDEYYSNIEPAALMEALFAWPNRRVESRGKDVYAVAWLS